MREAYVISELREVEFTELWFLVSEDCGWTVCGLFWVWPLTQ